MDNRTKKTLLLEAAKLIMSADEKSIKIIQNNPVTNLRIIERNAHSIKDPDPLSSTLSNISLKYPITCKTDFIRSNENIPSEMYLNRADPRKFNRTPCSISMITWWLENSGEVNEENRKIVQGILDKGNERLIKINNYNWSVVRYAEGQVDYERKRVATNPVDIKIPHEIKYNAIAQSLKIDNFIEYNEIPDIYLEQIDKIISCSKVPLRSIPNILHYILGQLDERYRFIPILPGMSEEFILFSHVLVQPTYRAINLASFVETNLRKNTIISKICINLIHAYWKGKYSENLVNSIYVAEQPFRSLLADTSTNKYVKTIKAMLGMPVSSSVFIKKFEFAPRVARIIKGFKTNVDGFKFLYCEGEEEVFFRSSNIKGFFVHNGDLIKLITINYCAKRQLISALAHVAVFIGREMEKVRGKTFVSHQDKGIFYWTARWMNLIGIQNEATFNREYGRYEPNVTEDIDIGLLKITSKIDFVEQPEMLLTKKDNHFINEKGQVYLTIPRVTEATYCEEIVSSNDVIFFTYLDTKILLKRILYIFYTNAERIQQAAAANDWSSLSQYIMERIPPRRRGSVSRVCRERCRKFVTSGHYQILELIVNYTFTGSEPDEVLRKVNSFMVGENEISMDFCTGLLVYNQSLNVIQFEGKHYIVERRKVINDNIHYHGLMRDFELRLAARITHEFEVRPLIWLRKNSGKIKDGTRFFTNYKGRYFIATKNSEFALEMQRTLQRPFIIEMEAPTTGHLEAFLKRRNEEDLTSLFGGTVGEVKRARTDKSSSS